MAHTWGVAVAPVAGAIAAPAAAPVANDWQTHMVVLPIAIPAQDTRSAQLRNGTPHHRH